MKRFGVIYVIPDRLAEQPQQHGDQQEPGAPRHQACRHEQRKIESRGPGGDGDDFVGDGRQPFDQDDPQAIFGEPRLKRRERRLIVIDLQ
jgi:hypothetical protein